MVKAECREVNFKSRVFDGRGEVGTKVAEGERVLSAAALARKRWS